MTNVKFGITTKPINSTSSVFYGGSTVTLSCRLKEPCSRQAPVFQVEGLTKLNNYNFAEWENFYYWVDDIVFLTNDIQEVHCHLDPLATFRDYIKDNDYYVLYGNQKHWNDWVDDPRMQPEQQHTYTGSVKSFMLFNDDNQWAHPEDKIRLDQNGVIFMRVMETASLDIVDKIYNSVTQADLEPHQGVNTYAIKYEDFKHFIIDMAGHMGLVIGPISTSSVLTNIQKLLQAAYKMWGMIAGAGSWRDNLISCVYVPIKWEDIAKNKYGSHAPYFFLGSVPCGMDSQGSKNYDIWQMKKPMEIVNYKGGVDIPWATDITKDPSITPTADGKYAYLRNSRWFTLQLYTPGGYCAVDVQELKGQTQLGVWTSLNIMTGEWAMRVTENIGEGSEVLASFAGCMGVDLTEFAGSADSAANQTNNIMNKIGTVIASVALKTDISQASSQLNAVSSYPTNGFSTQERMNRYTVMQGLSQNYDTARMTDFTANGIMGAFNPTGIDPCMPSAGMAGNITDMFLTDNFGKCFLIGVQYVPKDYANYQDFCNKHGYPVNAWKNLKDDDVKGYVKCAGAYLDYCPGATTANLSTINSYLNNGIVIEE